ncbi:MAG: outer membrane beta-barrel protein [Bacteroidota bacterium]
MKHFFLSSLSFILFLTAFSQQPEQQPDNVTMNAAVSEGLYGKLLDNATGKPIAAASVQIYVPGTNTDSLFDGMLTRPNGEFRFERLPVADSIKLVISALGYQPQEQYVRAGTNQTNRPAGFQRDLGNISLQTDVKQLSEVVVSATRPALQMGIDRKIFDVSKSLLAAGGTAVDIMKNIPSVSVDIEGNVELRNSTPQIFVDGRPTILTLDQIPADHIDKIELITNPSAKFDAASSGGIINVVLKKNKRIGLNGVISLSGGTPELFSGNLNINLRQGKFNFFASVGHNQSGGIARGQTLRQNKKGGVVTDYFNQFSKNERDRNFNSLRFGTDIFLSNRNTITISQDFSKGKFGNVEMQNQEYLDASRVLTYSGLRRSDGSSKFDRGSTRLNFKHNFPKEGKELTADVNYNYGSRTSLSDINTLYFKPDGSQYRQPSLVWNDGSNEENQLTIQADYVNPINESTKIETGLRSFTSTFKSYYNAYADDNGQAEKLPLSNNYAYDQAVTAAYFTFSKNLKSFSYQLGLRGEHSKFDGELVDSAYKFGYEYPGSLKNIWDGLFPSVYLTKKLNESNEMQFNYSRRIRRPQFWQLNPFVDINDPANLRQGNPALRPEFINSFEVNYNNTYKQGNFLAVVYFRNNPDDITEYSDTITAAQYQQFANAAIDPNAILNTFINASTTNRYGAEFTLQHKIGKNFDITPTVNLQYRTVSAKVNDLVLDNKGFNWEAKLITNYKIETERPSFFNNFGFQAIVDYESPQVIPQGKNIAEFQVDLAFRKDFMKNKKASLTLAVSDLFNSQRWGTIYDTEQFYQDSYRRWNVRNFRLTFSYKFGDNKFSLFNNNRGRENDDD